MAPEDRYQVVKELGRGGMGVVYLCNDTWLKREVAIKTLKPPEGGDTQAWREAVQRLIREAQAAVGLDHPHIVPIYDVLPYASPPCIIMKYVRGKNLAEVAPLGAPAEASFVVLVLIECAAALDYAHSGGRVHRDFKPANVMLDDAGGAIIMDFGIAKLVDSHMDLTHGNVIGDPGVHVSGTVVRSARGCPERPVLTSGSGLQASDGSPFHLFPGSSASAREPRLPLRDGLTAFL